jgi:hypothetical protein
VANQCEKGWERGDKQTASLTNPHNEKFGWLGDAKSQETASVTEQPVRQASSQTMNTVGAAASTAGPHMYIMLYYTRTYTVPSFIILSYDRTIASSTAGCPQTAV